MTNISVDLGGLAHAATRTQAVGRDSAEHARAVQSVLGHLDMQIKAREHFDGRLVAATRDLSIQSQSLQRHSAFLAHAVGEYERAERSVVGASREFNGRYPSESTAGMLRRLFKNAWGGLVAGVAVVDMELLGSLLAGSWSVVKTLAKAVKEYAKFFTKINLSTMDFLFRDIPGGLHLNPKIMLWTIRYAKQIRFLGIAAAVVQGVIDGVVEFKDSAGSFVAQSQQWSRGGWRQGLGRVRGRPGGRTRSAPSSVEPWGHSSRSPA